METVKCYVYNCQRRFNNLRQVQCSRQTWKRVTEQLQTKTHSWRPQTHRTCHVVNQTLLKRGEARWAAGLGTLPECKAEGQTENMHRGE